VLAGLLVLAWLLVGVSGAYRYVHRYDLYRGFAKPHTPAGVPRGTVSEVRFRSRALAATEHFDIYLPPGYAAAAAAGRRFPVLYLLHGFPGQPRVFVDAGAIGVDADVMIARRAIRPAILVMPAGPKGYFHGDTEWANASAGRWMDEVLEIVRLVDRRYATLRDRQHRGLAGLSEGGYGAINIALRHLGLFSIAQSWSGYFRQTRSSVFAHATPAAILANSPVDYVPAMAPRIRRLGFRAWLYQGRVDTSPPADMTRFGDELHAAGAEVHYGFFRGGHDWALWRRQLPHMLRVASRWFGQRPGGARAFSRTGHSLPLPVLQRIRRARVRRCLAKVPGPGVHIGGGCRRLRRAHRRALRRAVASG